ncbi:MAG: hypothetical protein KAR80_03855, partial [Rhodospirillaceae bacterium]|nr:hypothetical protein [Rhodospirillaceae bacterium]
KPEALPEVFEAPAKAETIAPIAEVAETQSATMRFFSTFLDFFKPPNTTGVVRTVKRDPEQDKINVSQQSSRSAVEPRDGGVEASVLAQQLKDLEQQQSEFLINNPPPQELPAEETEEEEIELVFEDDTEPEQDAEETAATEPDIVPDPFATPTDVGKLEAKLPPHPAEEGDEVAATEEEIPGLEGLLDSTDESAPPAGSGGEDSLGEEWALKELDSASLPDVEIPSASDIIASGEMLEGVHLALGEDVHIGQEFTEKRRQLMKQETIHRPCVDKHGDGTVFCIDTVFWPLDIEENFRVDTIMYQGTRAIARYDDGLATNFHAMFDSNAFDIIANYYTNRYGSPTKSIARAIAPFAKPRQENPTMIWQSREPGTDLVINLEIRKFDDARGGFPDTERGAIMLYKNHAEPIFPKLSQLELMVLEPDDKATAGLTSSEPATPDSVW